MIELYQRKSKYTEMKPYCHHSKPNDFMEYCEWYNGEGFDINLSDNRIVSLTWGQWEAMQALITYKE